jgi:hypothetical protein
MPYFDDARAVYGHIGYLLRAAVADEDIAGRLRTADAVVQFDVRRPDARITVALRQEGDLRVDLGETELRPDVVLAMDGDTAHGYWQGQVNIASALARGQIKAHGPVAAILRLVPLGKDLFPRYRELVEGGDLPPLAPAAEEQPAAEAAPAEEPPPDAAAPGEEPPPDAAPGGEPSAEAAAEQPSAEAAAEQPSAEAAAEQPSVEAAAEQPSVEAAAQEPSAERAAEEPSAEPATERPPAVAAPGEPAAQEPPPEPAAGEPPAAGEGAEEVVPAAGEGAPAEAPGPAPGVRPDDAG